MTVAVSLTCAFGPECEDPDNETKATGPNICQYCIHQDYTFFLKDLIGEDTALNQQYLDFRSSITARELQIGTIRTCAWVASRYIGAPWKEYGIPDPKGCLQSDMSIGKDEQCGPCADAINKMEPEWVGFYFHIFECVDTTPPNQPRVGTKLVHEWVEPRAEDMRRDALRNAPTTLTGFQ